MESEKGIGTFLGYTVISGQGASLVDVRQV